MTVGGGETRDRPSGWSVDTALGYIQAGRDADRTYADTRFSELRGLMDERRATWIARFAEVEAIALERDHRYAEHFAALKEAVDVAWKAHETALERAVAAASTLAREKDVRDEQRFSASQQALRDALKAQDDAVRAALAAAKDAVTKAEGASEKRFDAVNEFRAQLNDMINTLMPRSEANVLSNAQNEKIRALEERVNGVSQFMAAERGKDTGSGDTLAEQRTMKAENRANLTMAISLIFVVIAIVGFIVGTR